MFEDRVRALLCACAGAACGGAAYREAQHARRGRQGAQRSARTLHWGLGPCIQRRAQSYKAQQTLPGGVPRKAAKVRSALRGLCIRVEALANRYLQGRGLGCTPFRPDCYARDLPCSITAVLGFINFRISL